MRAVNLGGDTDTLACCVGSVLGALHGPKWIPSRWRGSLEDGLRGRREIESLAEQLVKCDFSEATGGHVRSRLSLAAPGGWAIVTHLAMIFVVLWLRGQAHALAGGGPSSLLGGDLDVMELRKASSLDFDVLAVLLLFSPRVASLWAIFQMQSLPTLPLLWGLEEIVYPQLLALVTPLFAFVAPTVAVVVASFEVFAHRNPLHFLAVAVAMLLKFACQIRCLRRAASEDASQFLWHFAFQLVTGVLIADACRSLLPLAPVALPRQQVFSVLLLMGPVVALAELCLSEPASAAVPVKLSAKSVFKELGGSDAADALLAPDEVLVGLQQRGLRASAGDVAHGMVRGLSRDQVAAVFSRRSLCGLPCTIANGVMTTLAVDFPSLLSGACASIRALDDAHAALLSFVAVLLGMLYLLLASGTGAAGSALAPVIAVAPAVLKGIVVVLCVDQALSDLLVLETFRHGTHILAAMSIAVSGGDPLRRASPDEVGSQGPKLGDVLRGFHVLKDQGFVLSNEAIPAVVKAADQDSPDAPAASSTWLETARCSVLKRVLPNKYKFLSGRLWLSELCVSPLGLITTKESQQSRGPSGCQGWRQLFCAGLANLFGGLCIALVPTVRLRATEQIVRDDFTDDPCFSGSTLVTEKPISFILVGVLGTVSVGLSGARGWPARLRRSPFVAAGGALQLALAAALVALAPPSWVYVLALPLL